MYVDLNQLRAGVVSTPEASRDCSIWYRIQARQQTLSGSADPPMDRWLAPLTLTPDMLGDVPSSGADRASDKGLLDVTLDEYLKLLDWAGRELRSDKRGSIPADLPPILERLGLKSDKFLDAVQRLQRLFPRLVGPVSALRERAAAVGRRWMHGVRPAAELFQ